MKTEIHKLLNMKQFFSIIHLMDNSAKFNLKQPSQMLIKNIHMNWLQYIHAKTHNKMPVYLNESSKKLQNIPSGFGTIKQNVQKYDENTALEIHFNSNPSIKKSILKLDIIVQQQDALQYFIQWQRYRKYWWSTISTTPSLFSVNELRYEDKTASVDVVAQLPWGDQPVESVTIHEDKNEKKSHLSCALCLEDALFVLLLDGLTNNTKANYLRLHRKIAPYKFSFALDLKENATERDILCKIATLLHQKLESKKISTWLPNFSLPYESQITENLHMGVTYTVILDESILQSGIFNLMNSSTGLREQVHVADFHKYATMIFNKNSDTC